VVSATLDQAFVRTDRPMVDRNVDDRNSDR